MSVNQFKDTIKSAAYKTWFSRVGDTVLRESVKDLRASQETAEKTSFFITQTTIRDILGKLLDGEVSDEQVKQVYTQLKNSRGSRKPKQLHEPYVKDLALYFPRVSMGSISTILENGFKGFVSPDKKISDFFQKGHVFGVATKTLEQSIGKLKSNQTIDPTGKEMLLDVLREVHANLEKEDIATSNFGDLTYGLYAKYRKNSNRYLVEMQLKEANQESGGKVAPISNALRRYFGPESIPASEKTGIKFREQDAFFKKLVESKGSPSFIDLIEHTVVEALNGRKTKEIAYTVPETLIAKKIIKVKENQLNKKIKAEKKAVTQMIAEVKAIPVRDPKLGVSLSSLQLLINAQLQDVISANMGDGDSKSVLNYRTGRLASSAQVERLTQSREGMITAFYRYMKNPYATFSEGGRQQSPRSRDPKLLISKSIRDIAATMVTNRLRAIAV